MLACLALRRKATALWTTRTEKSLWIRHNFCGVVVLRGWCAARNGGAKIVGARICREDPLFVPSGDHAKAWSRRRRDFPAVCRHLDNMYRRSLILFVFTQWQTDARCPGVVRSGRRRAGALHQRHLLLFHALSGSPSSVMIKMRDVGIIRINLASRDGGRVGGNHANACRAEPSHTTSTLPRSHGRRASTCPALEYQLETVGLPASMVGTLLLLGRVWDAFFYPYVGRLVDQTQAAAGKRRYWLIRSALPYGPCS